MKEWPVCEKCGKEVTTAAGTLAMMGNEYSRYMKEEAEFDRKHPRDEHGCRVIQIGDAPKSMHWTWGHAKCLGEDIMYGVDAERMDTEIKALSWTLHMMEKTWIPITDWDRVIRALFKVPFF